MNFANLKHSPKNQPRGFNGGNCNWIYLEDDSTKYKYTSVFVIKQYFSP